MNLEGLEMIAVLIVIVLFVKVLEQFGLIEAGLEGKGALFGGLSFFCSSSALVGTCEWGVRCYLVSPSPTGTLGLHCPCYGCGDFLLQEK